MSSEEEQERASENKYLSVTKLSREQVRVREVSSTAADGCRLYCALGEKRHFVKPVSSFEDKNATAVGHSNGIMRSCGTPGCTLDDAEPRQETEETPALSILNSAHPSAVSANHGRLCCPQQHHVQVPAGIVGNQ
ncbi:unnamed protein product, partial [Ectocarpus sp. 12 AP-2014]